MSKKSNFNIVIATLLSSVTYMSHAQTFFNNGAPIGVTTGGVMIVKTGGGLNDGSLENTANGQFKNKGQVTIEGSFVNTSGVADGFAAATGEYIVLKDWVNNATFNADQSTVFLRGNTQQITGSNATTFYNLNCETASSVKSQTIDANVQGLLTLNNNELATDVHKMTVLNTDPSAIVINGVNDAFVSSEGVGKLVRNTNSTDEYLFPLGWNNAGIPIKREVAISPTDASNHSYEARFAFNTNSATTTTDDGYNVSNKSGSVQAVNDKFYHLLASADNTPASLSILFDPNQDGSWTSIGRWESAPQWEDLLQANVSTLTPRSRVVRPSWVATTRQAHALVTPLDVTKEFDFPNAFVPGATDPNVKDEDKYFTIINVGKKVILDELMVFNRWGEMVFNSKRDGTDRWNGEFQGKLQLQGNYTFLAKVRKAATNESLPPVKGNLALIW